MATAQTLEYTTTTEAPAQAPDQATPAETQTAPRLSEALRYGAMNVEQAFDAFVDARGRMCALGTIWHGMGYDVEYDSGVNGFVMKYPEWGFLIEKINTRPLQEGVCFAPDLGCSQVENLGSLVVHLNDAHRMPRDQIADRLSGFGL